MKLKVRAVTPCLIPGLPFENLEWALLPPPPQVHFYWIHDYCDKIATKSCQLWSMSWEGWSLHQTCNYLSTKLKMYVQKKREKEDLCQMRERLSFPPLCFGLFSSIHSNAVLNPIGTCSRDQSAWITTLLLLTLKSVQGHRTSCLKTLEEKLSNLQDLEGKEICFPA